MTDYLAKPKSPFLQRQSHQIAEAQSAALVSRKFVTRYGHDAECKEKIEQVIN